jgi:hypothetical protein
MPRLTRMQYLLEASFLGQFLRLHIANQVLLSSLLWWTFMCQPF